MNKNIKSVGNTITDNVDFLNKIPKIDLHRHLEGSFDIKTLFKLAKKNNIDCPKNIHDFSDYCQFPKNHDSDFLLFLSKFYNNWYASYSDIEQVVYHSVLNFKNENLSYLELRFSPEHFSLKNNFDRNEVTKLVTDTALNAAKEIDLPINFLLTFNRSMQSSEDMLKLYNSICKLEIESIRGVDLAGDEINYPPELFIDFFTEVHSRNIHKIDIHAGEVTPSEQIWTAIEKLHASRIGHGVSAIDDTKLQKELIEKNIFLCQCITSNFQTNAWHNTKNHPLAKLYKKGVPISISPDDPTIQNSTLLDDYKILFNDFDFTVKDFINLNKKAVEATFLTNLEKKELLNKIEERTKSFS